MRQNVRLSTGPGLKSLIPAAVLVALLSACVSFRRRPAADTGTWWRDMPLGEVARVNYPLGYVILQCIVLPSTGQVLKVYHGPVPVAAVRVTEVSSDGWAAAEVLQGTPAEGDLIKERSTQQRAN